MGLYGRFQVWCATDELHEMWCVEYDLIEEVYNQAVELGGIDVGHEVVQIFADPSENKLSEREEGRACPRRRTSICSVRARPRGSES